MINLKFKITTPCLFCRLFPKFFKWLPIDQLYDYFTANELLCDCQYGLRKKHSTENVVLELAHRILLEIDKGNAPITIFLDLSKAFDTLDHTLLVKN